MILYINNKKTVNTVSIEMSRIINQLEKVLRSSQLFPSTKINKLTTFILIIFCGVFFRLFNPLNIHFGFDQVQILENAHQIIQGNLTLIGPRTGPATMFTGPLIYYLSAFVLFFVGDVWTVVLVPVVLAVATGLILFFLTRYYFNQKIAMLSLTVWAFSPFLVNLDRVFWNPNLSLLASTILFIPLISSKKNRNIYLDLILLLIGSFLAYQAHFSGLILLGIAVITIFLSKRTFSHKLISLCLITLGFLFSISSIIIFDLKNNFLNFHGFLDLLNTDHNTDWLIILQSFIKHVYIIIETTGKVLVQNSAQLGVILIVGSLCLLYGLSMIKQKEIKLSFFWIILVALALAFYSGQKPEYYFLIALPAIIFIVTIVFNNLTSQSRQIILTLFILTATLANLNSAIKIQDFNLLSLTRIKQELSKHHISEIIMDIPPFSRDGLDYMIRDFNLTETGQIAHIGHSTDLEFANIIKINDFVIWMDQRTNDKNYLMTNQYFIETPINTLIFPDNYSHSEAAQTTYVITKDNIVLGKLFVADMRNRKSPDWINNCTNNETLLDITQDHDLSTLTSQFNRSGNFCLKLDLHTDKLLSLDEIKLF